MDGWRATLVRQDGSLRALDRRGLNLEAIAEMLEDRVPENTIIDGELVPPRGEPASMVTHYLSKDARGLTFRPFAVPLFRGEDRRFSSDWGTMDATIRHLDFEPPGVQSFSGDVSTLQQYARHAGVEGYVLKERVYGGWWKVKAVETADVIVVDTKPGRGKHANRLGALVCAVVGDAGVLRIIASVGKGADDDWRDRDPSQVLGRVCEITHEGAQSGGRLRFSSFVRWRPDKPTDECTVDQIDWERTA